MKRQHGAVLPLLLVLIALGALAWQFDADRLDQIFATARAERTRDVLAEAREALISHALTYAITHDDNPRLGLLPCPDMNNNGSSGTVSAGGSPQPSCGTANQHAIGRLPFRTLALPRLLDGNGDCLWYAVAGRFKNNPDSNLSVNWDAPGQFNLVSTTGAALTDPASDHRRAVAVVFAPGKPIQSQNRSVGGQGCPGGNEATTEVGAFLESIFPSATGVPFEITEGDIDGNGNNDAVAWITVEDIFGRLLRTRYFEEFLNQRLMNLLDDLAALPPPASSVQSSDEVLERGEVPSAAVLGITDAADRVMHDDWRQMFQYLRCVPPVGPGNPVPSCLSLNGNPCRALVVFAGLRTGAQARTSATLEEYLEEPDLSAIAGFALTYANRPTVFDHLNPSRDVFGCIT